MNGGQLIAEVLKAQGVPFLFTLVGDGWSTHQLNQFRACVRNDLFVSEILKQPWHPQP